MKKVYVTAVSVFMAACAAASLPMSKHVPAYPVDAASQKSDASAALLMKSRRSVQRSGSSEKATRNDLLGTFVWDHYRFMNPGGWQYMFCFPEIVAGEKDDEVIIEGFWADYDDSVYPPEPITRAKAVFDYEAQTLSIEPGYFLGQYESYPHYIYVSDWNTDVMLDEPIVLDVSNSGRLITYRCDFQEDGRPTNCLLITSFPDKVGQVVDKGVDFIGEIVMNKYNEVMELSNTTVADEGFCPIYIRRTVDGFVVHNFGGYGYEPGLPFSIDLAKGTCTAARTLFGKDIQIDADTKADIYFASVDGGDIEGIITPTENGKVYNVDIGEWSFYDAAADEPLVRFSRSSFPVNLDISGIVNVERESYDEARVEYFTLQGLRVAEPEKGMIVIKRQGDKVSKTVVR